MSSPCSPYLNPYLNAFKHPVHMDTRVRPHAMNYFEDVQQISEKTLLPGSEGLPQSEQFLT